MPSDVDVVRCASPWPGIAAQLLETLAALGDGEWSLSEICTACPIGLSPGDIDQVLTGLSAAGVCYRSGQGASWRTPFDRVEIFRLATLLRGADHFRRLRFEAPNLEFAVTMPMAPSHLERQLPASAGRPGGYLPTTQAFSRIAHAAQKRIVVLTPFINRTGFDWLRSIFETASKAAEKIVVLRDAGQHSIDLSVHHAGWLRGLGVVVFDYSLAHDRGSGRALSIETFHAKIVLADDHLAYVGSANLLGSGDGTSLEAGVIVDGRAANQVSRLVGAVLAIARRI